MKKILLLLVVFLSTLPIYVFASQDDFVSMNLEETLADEQIEVVFSNYEETDEQIPIYLFRGSGCDFCRSFLSYLNSITDEYGKYFKLVSYDVWSNENNSILLDSVASFLKQEATGVPYIVIGDKAFAGYAEDFNEDIKSAIIELYESADRYDVFEEMPEVVAEPTNETLEMSLEISNKMVIICNIIVVTIGVIIIIVFSQFKYKKLYLKLDELEKQLKELNKKNIKLEKKGLKIKI